MVILYWTLNTVTVEEWIILYNYRKMCLWWGVTITNVLYFLRSNSINQKRGLEFIIAFILIISLFWLLFYFDYFSILIIILSWLLFYLDHYAILIIILSIDHYCILIIIVSWSLFYLDHYSILIIHSSFHNEKNKLYWVHHA